VTGVTVSGADNSARPLISILSKKLRVRAQVNEADIGQVAVGQEGKFKVNAFPDRDFTAKITAVTPQATTISNVQFYDILLDIEGDTTGLKAGMPCDVTITIASKTNVLTVPRQALSFPRTYAQTHTIKLPPAIQAGSNNGVVLVVRNGIVEARNIKLGISNNQLTEVIDGLKPGELVAVGQAQNNRGQNNQTRTPGSASGTAGGNAGAGNNTMRFNFMPGGGGGR
jgi:HlyD family secretion protein